MTHDWQTIEGRPGISYDTCTHCRATTIFWLIDGVWKFRTKTKECK